MRKNLTDTAVRAIKPSHKQQEFWDSNLTGLVLLVSPGGTKTFQLCYRYSGRKRRMSLGRFDILSVAAARQMGKVTRARVYQGHDPAAERKTERQAETFSVLTDEYLEAKKHKRTWKEDKRMIDVELSPRWGARKAIHISRRDVRQLLQQILNRDAPIAANRILSLVRSIFNFAVDREWMDANPCYRIKNPAPAHERDRVLKPHEIRLIWHALERQSPSVRDILRFQFLTAQRVGEIRQMRREDVDLETGWWTIPAEFAKNKLSHRVPLSTTAAAMLESRINATKNPWVFPGLRDSSKPFDYQTIHKAVRQIRQETHVHDWSSHDLRRTVVSLLTGSGVSSDTARKIINHVEPGAIRTYNRHPYDGEKRVALEAWARRLEAIVDEKSGGNVVPFAS